MESKYYFHETSGILIRVETEWHLVSIQDNRLWQHYSIEKNLISVDGELLNYTYVLPPAYTEPNNNLPLIPIGICIGGIFVAILSVGIKSKKK